MAGAIPRWILAKCSVDSRQVQVGTAFRTNPPYRAGGRADDLINRLQSRLAEIENARRISPMPPIITGGALVIPKGLIHKLSMGDMTYPFGQGDRQSIEYAEILYGIQRSGQSNCAINDCTIAGSSSKRNCAASDWTICS